MHIKTADYIGSYVTVDKCPDKTIAEFAFIGRSNVGKSSLINYLTGRRKLSKVSVTPGKTQTLNFFLINNQFHLVDLPGYGFAKVSQEMRKKWMKMIEDYLLKRKQLTYLAVLIDARIPPQEIDLNFINFLGENRVPFYLVFTKADKPGSKETSANIQQFLHRMRQDWEELPPAFVTSSEKGHGREQIWEFLNQFVK